MAHEIETHTTSDGQTLAAAIFARQDAWHRLGTTMPTEFTAEQAMEIAHLGNWNVRKEPVTTTVLTDNGVYNLPVPGRYATVRDNPFTSQPEVLGIVGEHYTPIQNEQHAEFLNALVDESGAHFDTAGSLREGREVFVTMKMPNHLLIGGQDRCDLNLIALNSHDGTSSFRILTEVTRVVCANTQRAALAATDNLYRVRHTVGATGMISQVRDALGISFKYLADFEAEAEKMIQETLREGQFMDIIRREFSAPDDAAKSAHTRADNLIDALGALYYSPANTNIVGTAWGGYQALTEYADHFSNVQTKGGDAGMVRAERVALGAGDQFKARAFDMFRSLATV